MLEKISTFTGTNRIREYGLSYDASPSSKRLLLKSVQECAYDQTSQAESCLPVTQFAWHESAVSGQAVATPAALNQTNVFSINQYFDINGDGRRELTATEFSDPTSTYATKKHYAHFFDENGTVSTVNLTSANIYLGTGQAGSGEDVNGDGRADLYDLNADGRMDSLRYKNSKWELVQFIYENGGQTEQVIAFSMPAAIGQFANSKVVQDMNADGWPDFVHQTTCNGTPCLNLYVHNQNASSPGFVYSRKLVDLKTHATTFAVESYQIKDINGDSLPDVQLSIANATQPAGRTDFRYLIPTHNGSSVSFPSIPMSLTTFGLPEESLPNNKYVFADINGDGLEDYVVAEKATASSPATWHVYLFNGKSYTSKINTGSSFGIQTVGSDFRVAWKSLSVSDINGDGISELFMPVERVSGSCVDYAINNQEFRRCDDELHMGYTAGPTLDSLSQADLGLYKWKVLYLHYNGSGISTEEFDPQITAGLQGLFFSGHAAPKPIDIDGDGQQEFIWSVQNALMVTHDDSNWVASGIQGTPALAAGWHIRRFGYGKELLLSATDGFNQTVSWEHHPISHNPGRQVTALKLYDLPANDSERFAVKDGQHYYFTSSMHVVSRMTVSGPSIPALVTEYAYRENMYNSQGRGVQGFRQVITESFQATGKRLRTTTTFLQKFPFAGQVIETEVFSVDDARVLSHSNNTWRWLGPVAGAATPPDAGINALRAGTGPFDDKTYLPWLEQSIAQQWDVNGASMGSSTSTQSQPDVNGNIGTVTQTRQDTTVTHSITSTRTFEPVNTSTVWWPNKMTEERTDKTQSGLAGADSKSTSTKVLAWNDALRKPTKTQTGDPSVTAKQLITENSYNAFGQPDSVSTSAANDPNVKRSVSTEWTSDGYFPSKVTDAVGQVSELLETDPSHGQVKRAKDAFGNIVETRFDAFGRAVWAQQQGRVSTGDAMTTSYEWATSTEKAAVPSAVYKVTKVSPNVAPSQTSWHDAFNRVVRVQSEDPLSSKKVTVDTTFNAFGHVTRQSAPYYAGEAIAWTQFSGHDVLGRPASKILPNDSTGLTISYQYNGLNASVQVGSNSAYTISRSKNVLGQWWQTTDQGSEGAYGQSVTTDFRYDANGNPISISRNGVANSASYDNIGQKLSMTDPERGTWQFEYNIWGELTRQKDAKNQYTWFDYDAAGRPLYRRESTSSTKPSTHVVEWIYDKSTVDNNTNVTAKPLRYARKSDSGGTISKTFHYNAEGLPRQTDAMLTPFRELSFSFSTSVSYNSNDLPNAATLPNARGTISTSYNSKGFATTSVTAGGQTINPYQILALDAFGNAVSSQYGNGLYGAKQFSAQTGRILGTCVNSTQNCTPYSQGNLQGITYAGTANGVELGYDEYGNLKGQYNVIQNVVERFQYDRRMRLTQSYRKAVLGAGFPDIEQTTNYAYDALGNLIEKSDFAKVIDYTLTGKPHQAHKAWADTAKSQLVAEYVYDANGNLTSSTGLAAHARTSVYNYQMVPTNIVRGTASSTFAYDEGNERWFEKHVSAGKTEKIYKLGKAFELKFTTEAGTTTEEEQHYLGANAQLMYKKAQNGKLECYQWRYLHLDRMGSVETITNKDGQVLERRGFDPFGKPRAGHWMMDATRDGTTSTEKGLFSKVTTRGYTGHDHIDSVGVIHMNGRTYDPELGRFMGVDPFMQAPLNSQSLNPYSYVMNNPLAGTDPTGYTSECVGADKAACDKKKFSFLGFLESKGLGWTTGGNGKKGGDAVRAQMADDMAGISGLRQRQRDELYAFFGIKLTPTVTVREVKVDENNNAKGGTEGKGAGDQGSALAAGTSVAARPLVGSTSLPIPEVITTGTRLLIADLMKTVFKGGMIGIVIGGVLPGSAAPSDVDDHPVMNSEWMHSVISEEQLGNFRNQDTSRTVTNSAGGEVTRRFVKNQDELLGEAEKAAGGSLDNFENYKPDWWVSPDGSRRIEWNPVGHANTNEGPHVTVRDFDGKRHSVVDKIFIEGQEKYK